MASTVGRVQDLVVEDGEVEGQAKADGVSGGQLGLSDIGSALKERVVLSDSMFSDTAAFNPDHSHLVGVVSSSGGTLALLAGGELSEVAVVVTLPISRSATVSFGNWTR